MFDFLSQKFSSIFSRMDGAKKLTEHNIKEALGQVQEALLKRMFPMLLCKVLSLILPVKLLALV
jgi:signal recognition particle GTPase